MADDQFGFALIIPQRIKRVVNYVKSNKRNRKSTGLLLLDIEKAFDSVWQGWLNFQTKHLWHPQIPSQVSEIICDWSQVPGRNTRVIFQSSLRSIPAGVPQGNVLSPLLYSLFISDFKKPKNCEIAYNADDTGLMAVAKQTKTITNRLLKGLKSCNIYPKKWKIQLNAAKTSHNLLIQ